MAEDRDTIDDSIVDTPLAYRRGPGETVFFEV